MQLVDLQVLCGCTQAIKQEKIYKQGQLKLPHINFAILNSHVTIIYLRFIKSIYFYVVKQKNRKQQYWLFSCRKTVTIKLHLSENCTFQNLVKIENYYLLKSLEISWLFTKNLKESYYQISADSFIKNNTAYDFRVGICFMSK